MKLFAVLFVSALTACVAQRPAAPYSVEAQELIRTCRYDEARALLDARMPGVRGEERAATLLQFGSLEENTGNLPQAVVHYRAALAETQPRTQLRSTAQRMLGMAASRLRDYDTAIASLAAVVEYHDSRSHRGGTAISWQTHAALGVSLAESGRLADAAAQFARALQQTGRAHGSAIRAVLTSWQHTAERAARQGRQTGPDDFWRTAYGSNAALTASSDHYELVPLERVTPRYPYAALTRGQGGYVEMEVTIDERGKPTHIRIVDSFPRGVFDRDALASVSQWKFQPRIVDCRAVVATGTQRIEFRVEGEDDDDPFPGPESVPRAPLPRERN